MPPFINDLFALMLQASVGYARVAPVFYILPFLNTGVINGVVRQTIILLVAIGVLPLTASELTALAGSEYVALAVREALVGLVLGCLLALPFWIFHALGSLIDNQRGATISSTMDPVNGIETSEMANFFNLFAAAVFLQGGGMSLVLATIARSYTLCSPLGVWHLNFLQTVGMIDTVVSQSLVLGAPLVLALLLSEVMLGLLSRFAPQLNAFGVSLTIKSAIALIIMLLYFEPVLVPKISMLAHNAPLEAWFGHGGR